MRDKEEKIIDIKGTIENFIEEEKPELSQEEEIKAYKKGDIIEYTKKKRKSEEDEENEDDEHLKRLKKELLASLERVNDIERKIFEEKEKENLKNLKIKSKEEKIKSKDKIIEQMREKVQEGKERSRE